MVTINTFKRKSISAASGSPLPSHCPNPACRFHTHAPRGQRWFCPAGTLRTKRHGTQRRFLCFGCERSFSDASFLNSYYEKKDVSCQRILDLADRQISLRKWAMGVGVHPGVLKLRLCKLANLMIKRVFCTGLWGSVVIVYERLIGLWVSGVDGFKLIRELIVSLKEILDFIEIEKEPARSYLYESDQKSVLYTLRVLICRWRYRFGKDMWYHTKYQIE